VSCHVILGANHPIASHNSSLVGEGAGGGDFDGVFLVLLKAQEAVSALRWRGVGLLAKQVLRQRTGRAREVVVRLFVFLSHFHDLLHEGKRAVAVRRRAQSLHRGHARAEVAHLDHPQHEKPESEGRSHEK